MTRDELQGLIMASGIQSRIKGEEVVLATCTFCGNAKWNLELNADKGVFHAWCCGAGGRVDALIGQLTGHSVRIAIKPATPSRRTAAPPTADDFHSKAIADVPSAAHYLTHRGITADVAAIYGIRVCMQEGHQLYGRIVIPAHDFWNGTLLGWMGRSYTGGNPKYLSTMRSKAVTGWRQRLRNTPVIVVEGAFDGIAVHRAGYQAAVLGGTSTPDVLGFAARVPADVPMLILLDSDANAQAARLYWQMRQVHENVFQQAMLQDTDPADLNSEKMQELVGVALGGLKLGT